MHSSTKATLRATKTNALFIITTACLVACGPQSSTDPCAGDAAASCLDANATDATITDGGDAGARRSHLVGVYESQTATVSLALALSSGAGEERFTFGANGDRPCFGDWNGDGSFEPGLHRPSMGTFFLRNERSGGPADRSIAFGVADDIGLCGDWNGDGRTDLGVYRPAMRAFFLTTSLETPNAMVTTIDASSVMSGPLDVEPLVGDWDGDGDDDLALVTLDGAVVFRLFVLQGGALMARGMLSIAGAPTGRSMVRVIAGDWNGDGRDGVGVWGADTGTFFLRDQLSDGPAELTVAFGARGAANIPFSYVR